MVMTWMFISLIIVFTMTYIYSAWVFGETTIGKVSQAGKLILIITMFIGWIAMFMIMAVTFCNPLPQNNIRFLI